MDSIARRCDVSARPLHPHLAMHYLMRALARAATGIAGLAAMELVRRTTAPLIQQRPPRPTDVFESAQSISPWGRQHLDGESSTAAIGRIAFERLLGRSPSDRTKEALSWAVHFTYGVSVAALFAAIRRRPRIVRDGFWYGAALWLFGDELAVPLLGLADKPTAYHPTHHAQAFAQHVAFGIATAAATRGLERLS